MRHYRYLSIFLFLTWLLSCVSYTAQTREPEELFSSHFISLRAGKLHYFDSEPSAPADKPVMLCIHGFSSTACEYSLLAGELAPDVRVIAPDLPGSGLSYKPEAGYSIDFFVGIIREFRDTIGVGRVMLMGHSLGGQIALIYAHTYPGDVEKLILIAPYGLKGAEGGFFEWLAQSEFFIDLAVAFHNRLFLRWGLRYFAYHDSDRVDRHIETYLADSLFEQGGKNALAAICKQVLGKEPVDDLLPEIHHPALLIWGTEDRVLDYRWSRQFLTLLSHAELATIPLCGHAPMAERPVETAAAIRLFIEL
jgi:pimeloyl-ACP methyl ester carboxylesterase